MIPQFALYDEAYISSYINEMNIEEMNNDTAMMAIDTLLSAHTYHISIGTSEEGFLTSLRNAILNLFVRILNNLASYIKVFKGFVKRSESQTYMQGHPMNVRTVEKQTYAILAEKTVPTFIYKVGPLPIAKHSFEMIERSTITEKIDDIKNVLTLFRQYIDIPGTSMDLFKSVQSIPDCSKETKALNEYFVKNEANTEHLAEVKQFSTYFNSVDTFKRFTREVSNRSYIIYNEKIKTHANQLDKLDNILTEFIQEMDRPQYKDWLKDNEKSMKLLSDFVIRTGEYIGAVGGILRHVNILDHFVTDSYKILYSQLK